MARTVPDPGPPLHLQATSLTVILTGGQHQTRVTIPLNWQPPAPGPDRP
jgi:hypothetical protein